MQQLQKLLGQVLAVGSGVLVIGAAIAATGNVALLLGLFLVAGLLVNMSSQPAVALRQGVVAVIVNALLIFAIATSSEPTIAVLALILTWGVAIRA